MKLSFITDEATQDIRSACRLAQEEGIASLELRTVNGKNVIAFSIRECRELRRRISDTGLSVCCIASPVFKGSYTPELRGEYESLHRALDVASILGCPFTRIFSFWRDLERSPAATQIADALNNAANIAHCQGGRLLLENGRRTTHGTAKELLAILPMINTAIIGVLWDPANPIFGGLEKDPLGEAFVSLLPYVRHVHAKDPVYYSVSDRRYCEFGNGMLNFTKLMHYLRSAGFDGFVSAETHWRPGKLFTPSELDAPGGGAFSEGGLEATRSSLRYLRKLM